ncbi:helix-turn-helix domain-containing protein [Streptomyces sp. NPDC052301]|uniref:helix-turn-helix domain-containing protein n=1 Tax=Streptomyces sp. NPDC052301 TaxID=3365687 RepID=UPI0037CEB104
MSVSHIQAKAGLAQSTVSAYLAELQSRGWSGRRAWTSGPTTGATRHGSPSWS